MKIDCSKFTILIEATDEQEINLTEIVRQLNQAKAARGAGLVFLSTTRRGEPRWVTPQVRRVAQPHPGYTVATLPAALCLLVRMEPKFSEAVFQLAAQGTLGAPCSEPQAPLQLKLWEDN